MSRLSPRALVGALRWLVAAEALPQATPAGGSVGPVRHALTWLLSGDALPEAPPVLPSEDIGFFRWLLARERLPTVPEPPPPTTQEGVDAAG